MRRLWRTLLALVLIGLLLTVAAIVGAVAWTGDPLAHAVVTIDGSEVTLAQLQGSVALAALAIGVVLVALFLVVPFAIVLPLLAVGLALALAFIAIAGIVALLLSPLIALGWLIWRLARPARRVPMAAS